ncbi:MAG: gliding motility lipoprotein GldH [Bacteroidales bacterium]
MNLYISTIILSISLCLFTFCSPDSTYTETHSVPENWSKDSVLDFNIPVKDTHNIYSITLNISNTDSYGYSNLYLFTSITFPDNKVYKDTVEFVLATDKGEWIGEESFSTYTNTFMLRRGVKFPQPGIYTFSFEQAMRCKNKSCSISGIKSITLSLIQN